MRLVGDWWYYAFWSVPVACGALGVFLLWRIDQKLGAMLRLWMR